MAKEKAKKTARINIKTTPELKKSAEEKAAEKEVSLSRYIEVLIKEDAAPTNTPETEESASGSLHDLDGAPEIKSPNEDNWLNS